MSSYWEKREEKQREQSIEKESEYNSRIRDIYESAIAQIDAQIDAWYTGYAGKEGMTLADAKKLVSRLDIEQYAKLAAIYVPAKDFSEKANQQMAIYNLTMKINRLEFLKARLNNVMVVATDQSEKVIQEAIEDRIIEEYRHQAGILGDTILDSQQEALNTLVNASFHSATWSERIWGNQEILRKTIDKTLTDFLIQGLPTNQAVKDLEKRLRGKVKNSEYCARRLIVTERSRVAGQAQMLIYDKRGIAYYEFITEPGCCPDCEAISGKRFKVSDGIPGVNLQPMHPNCRCSTAMASGPDGDEFTEWLQYVDETNEENVLGYEEWLKRKKVAR